jgi:amino acid permease
MDKPKKEPVTLNQSPDSKLCLNCGFPNRNTDAQCMYCRTSLIEDSGLFNWVRQTYYILRWRWQLKQKRDSLESSPQESKPPIYRTFGFFILGVILSIAGIFVFTSAMSQNSFSSGLIALLLVGYGVVTMKTLFSNK